MYQKCTSALLARAYSHPGASPIAALRRHIHSAPSASIFQLIIVPNYLSSKIFTLEDAERLRMKVRGHFVITGTVRDREINGGSHTIIDVTALVAHAPLPSDRTQTLRREFSELMPSRYDMKSADSFHAIEFTASWTGLIAQYITGLAAGMSGDLDYAESQFHEVLHRLSFAQQGFLFYTKLQDRVPKHLSEIAFFRTREALKKWYQSKSNEDFREVQKRIADADARGYKNNDWRMVRGIVDFASTRNTTKARAGLRATPPKQRDAVWHLNMAFLEAYDGDLQKATRHYRKAGQIGIPAADVDVIVGQVEVWLLWQYELDPTRFELLYCLGFVNMHLKGDAQQAQIDFEAFLEKVTPGQLEPTRKLVAEWMTELKRAKLTTDGE